MNFREEQKRKTERIEAVIEKYLPGQEGFQKTLMEAMSYSVRSKGKRLRPMLMEESFRLFGGSTEVIEPFMAAIEMGAFRFASDFAASGRIAQALQILGNKAGIFGMIGGQTADIEAESGEREMTQELVLFIHEKKTAALIQAAMMIGAVLAGASKEAVDRMEKAAANIGIAFQIQDDILDVTSTTEILGKPVGSDEKNHKLTYVTMNGIEKAKEEVRRLSEEALGILNSFEYKNEFLCELVRSLINREK